MYNLWLISGHKWETQPHMEKVGSGSQFTGNKGEHHSCSWIGKGFKNLALLYAKTLGYSPSSLCLVWEAAEGVWWGGCPNRVASVTCTVSRVSVLTGGCHPACALHGLRAAALAIYSGGFPEDWVWQSQKTGPRVEDMVCSFLPLSEHILVIYPRWKKKFNQFLPATSTFFSFYLYLINIVKTMYMWH